MGSFVEKIRLVLDVEATNAKASLKSFGRSIGDADGVMGKFKAGASSAMSTVKANAGALALAGGAALVAFGIKALGAFTEVADAARDFGAATGQSVEDASRWIAIADDIGLTAADLQAGFGMVTKSLDASKWAEYGIATRDAGGEARSTNEILLDTFDVLSRETNLTERARLGKALLGKGYAGLAPMIGKSRAEYEKMLGAVEDGQVITDKELAKSERMKKAQDSLSDALGEVTLAFGEMVAELAPTIEALANSVGWVVDLNESVENLTGGLGIFSGGLANATELISGMGQATGIVNEIIAEQERVTRSVANATKFAAAEHNDLTAAADDLAASEANLAESVVTVTKGLVDYRSALDEAAGKSFDLESAGLGLAQAMDDQALAQQAVNDVLSDSKSTDADKAKALRGLRQDQINNAGSALDLAKAYAESTGASEGTVESIQAQINMLSMLKGQYPAMADDIQVMIDKLLKAPGAVDPAATQIGTNIAEGIGRGIDGSSYVAENAAKRVVNKAMQAAVAAGKIKSPSRLFADEVGAPIAAGIAEGIIEDSDKIDEALRRAIEGAAKTAAAESENVIRAGTDTLSGFWTGIDDQRSEVDMRKAVTDAQLALNKAMLTGDSGEVATATERLQDANYRLAKATQDMILVDADARASWAATAAAAGLTTQEIDGIIDATLHLSQVRADAAAEAAAIAAEAASAQGVRTRFAESVGFGLVTADELNHLKVNDDPAYQLAYMEQILARLDAFFAAVPKYAKGTRSAASGFGWTGENGPELVNFGAGGQSVHTAPESARMMQGGGPSLTVNAYGITDVAALARLASTEMAWLMKTRAA